MADAKSRAGPTLVVLGLLLVTGGCFCCSAIPRELQRWVFADNYVMAELEVTHFHYNPGKASRGPYQIDGVIHPGGEKVTGNSNDIIITRFAGPNSVVGRMPLRAEIEGKRVPVWYWPQHEDVRRWWHPSTVMSGSPHPGGMFLVFVLMDATLLASGVWCLRRGYRSYQALRTAQGAGPARRPAPTPPGVWPWWTGLVIIFNLIAWPLFLLLIEIGTTERVSPDGTRHVPRTAREMIVFGIALVAFATFPLGGAWLLIAAVRNRLRAPKQNQEKPKGDNTKM